MAERTAKSLTKTLEGATRADPENFNEDGSPRRPMHLKRGDPAAEAIEGKQKFKTPETATNGKK